MSHFGTMSHPDAGQEPPLDVTAGSTLVKPSERALASGPGSCIAGPQKIGHQSAPLQFTVSASSR